VARGPQDVAAIGALPKPARLARSDQAFATGRRPNLAIADMAADMAKPTRLTDTVEKGLAQIGEQ